MRLRAKRLLLPVAGWAFVLLGIAGLFLPILQGVLFLMIGLAILSVDYVWAHHLLRRMLRWFPGMERRLQRVRARVRCWKRRAEKDEAQTAAD